MNLKRFNKAFLIYMLAFVLIFPCEVSAKTVKCLNDNCLAAYIDVAIDQEDLDEFDEDTEENNNAVNSSYSSVESTLPSQVVQETPSSQLFQGDSQNINSSNVVSSDLGGQNNLNSSYNYNNYDSTQRDYSYASSTASSELEEESSILLPEVSSQDISMPYIVASNVDGSVNGKNIIFGVIAWICIALGILIVLIVLLGSKHSKNMKVGRKRYKKSRNNKRLLSDKYYRNIKRK